MDEKQLRALANELAKNLKTPEDLRQFDRLLKKLSAEAALNAEMTHHLEYEKNQSRITGMDNLSLLLYAKGMTPVRWLLRSQSCITQVFHWH